MAKNPPTSAEEVRDTGSIPGSGRSFVGGHGNPVQYSCLLNPRDRSAWQATVHGVTKSQTRLKRLSTHTRVTVVEVVEVMGTDRGLSKAGRWWLNLEGWLPGCVILGITVSINLSQRIT